MGQIINVISTWFALIMIFFHHNLGYSWGLSIILMTVVLRIVLFPASIKQIRSMEEMKKIQPLLKEIQEKYKDKPEEYQRRTMEVYKTHGVNPFSGCLPMLLQLPILWALYNLLQKPGPIFQGLVKAHMFSAHTIKGFLDSFEQENFLGLKLTVGSVFKPSFIILVLLSGLTTFLLQKISSPSNPSTDQEQSIQNSLMYFMPLFFTYITWTLPAGLGVYWVSSNILSIAQQYIIMRYFLKEQDNPDTARNGVKRAKKK